MPNKRKAPELRRTAAISAQVTPAQKARITAAALIEERTATDFVRTTILFEVERIERRESSRAGDRK